MVALLPVHGVGWDWALFGAQGLSLILLMASLWGSLLESLQKQKPATQHSQPARQLPVLLLLEGEGDISWRPSGSKGIGIGCGRLQHWLALQEDVEGQRDNSQRQSPFLSLSIGQTIPLFHCWEDIFLRPLCWEPGPFLWLQSQVST